MKKTLLITASQKGGCGKTVLACALLDHLRTAGMPVAAFDGDGAVGGFYKMHGARGANGRLQHDQDAWTGVVPYDIRDTSSRDLLFESLETDAPTILHDLAGGALLSLLQLFGDDVEGSLRNLDTALEDLDAELVVLHLVTRDEGSVASVRQYLDLTATCPRISHVAVVNRHAGRDADLRIWFGTADGRHGGRTRALLLERGGAEMVLPALDAGAMALVQGAGTPFSRAVEDRSLPLVQRQRIRQFLRAFASELTPELRDRLGVAT